VVIRKRVWFHLAVIVILTFLGSGFLLWSLLAGTPEQPIAFSHKVHVEKQIACTFCHQYADKSPQAGLPSVQLCMTCHQVIKADSPEIQKVRAYLDQQREIPWARVYGFPAHAHVRFHHQRHVAAGIDCAKCHGDVGQMAVAERAIRHTMGWCVECHKQNRSRFAKPRLATDCLTCHY